VVSFRLWTLLPLWKDENDTVIELERKYLKMTVIHVVIGARDPLRKTSKIASKHQFDRNTEE